MRSDWVQARQSFVRLKRVRIGAVVILWGSVARGPRRDTPIYFKEWVDDVEYWWQWLCIAVFSGG